MRIQRFALLTATLLLAACGSTEGDDAALPTGDDNGTPTDPAGDLAVAPSLDGAPLAWTPGPGLVVHEWGTFTSVQSSDGRPLEGLHHEEHALPSFVYGRASDDEYFECPPTKCMEMHPVGVTQKLETPVLYFYSEDDVEVTVDVAFPDGILSEWYPNATAYAPELYEWEEIADGTMSWTIDVEPGPADLIPVPADDIWAPSRDVASAPVRFGDEVEQFIFYRGLGAFEVPFLVEALPGGGLRITNDSDDAIPAVFLHNVDVESDEGMIASVGPLDARESILIEDPTFVPGPKEEPLPIDQLVPFAADLVAEELVATGLYSDEARAMVDTWSQSYFGTDGLRVLYVVPRPWTDALLPITIDPAPTELVRTMVGRVEVLTPEVEANDLAMVEQCAADWDLSVVEELGRFAEPRLRRALEQIADPEVRGFVEQAIEVASVSP